MMFSIRSDIGRNCAKMLLMAFLLAIVGPLRSVVVVVDAVGGCNVTMYPFPGFTGCSYIPDTDLNIATGCFLDGTGTIPNEYPSNFGFYSPTPSSGWTASYCDPGAGVYSFNLTDSSARGSVRFVGTVAAFRSDTPVGTEATIRLITTNNEKIVLGTFVAGINTAIQPPTQTATSTGTLESKPSIPAAYPNNGFPLCNTKLSYQVWDTREYGQYFAAIEITDPTVERFLKVFAVSGDTCPTLPRSDTTTGFHSLAAVGPGAYAAGFRTTITTTNWASCAIECLNRATCSSYAHTAVGSSCSLYNAQTGWGVLPSATIQSRTGWSTIGTKTTRRSYTSFIIRSEGVEQQIKFSRPSQYFGFQFASFVALNVAELPMVVLPLRSVTRFVVAAAQISFSNMSLTAFMEGGPVQRCGGLNETNSDYFASTFLNNGTIQNGTDGKCSAYYFCPPVSHQTAITGNLYAILPPSSCVNTTLRQSVLVYHDGPFIDRRFYYYTLSTDTKVLMESHALSSATQLLTQPVLGLDGSSSSPLLRYTLAGYSLDVSPPWRWTDADGATRWASLLCEANGLLGYSLFHNRTYATGTAYRCGEFANISAITAACDADANCHGFTLKVTNTSLTDYVENPECLISSTAGAMFDYNSTLFTKQWRALNCSFLTMSATQVTVRITNAVPSATYAIFADNTQVGSCTAQTLASTASTSTGEGTCSSYAVCYTGAIPSSATSLVVVMSATAPYNRQCPLYAFSARVDFTITSVDVQPAATCLDDLSLSGACSVVSSTAPSCPARNAVGVKTPSSYCAASDSVSLAAPQGTPKYSVMTVLDFSSVPALPASGAAVSVIARLTSGASFTLGWVSSSASGIYFAARRRSGQKSINLCASASDQAATGALASVQVFPVRPSIAAQIQSIDVKGPGIRVVSAALVNCLSFPVPRFDIDRAFHSILPAVRIGSPAYQTVTAESFAHCGNLCGADLACKGWTFSNGSTCELKAGVGGISALANLTVRGLTSGISTSVLTVENAVPPSPMTALSELLTSLIGTRSVLFFGHRQAKDPKQVVLHVSGVNRIDVSLLQMGFGESSFISIVTPGGGVTCGNNFRPFGRGQVGYSSCITKDVGQCPTIHSPSLFSGPVNLYPMFTPTGEALLATCTIPFMGILSVPQPSTGTIWSGIQYNRLLVSSTVTPAAAILSLSNLGHSVVGSQNMTFDGSQVTTVISYNTAQDDPGAPMILDVAMTASCTILNQLQYDIDYLADGLVSARYACDTYQTMQAATVACNADSLCKGFTVDLTTGTPKCLFSSNVTQVAVSFSFFKKVETTTCQFILRRAGGLKIRLAQVGLGFVVNTKLNGVTFKQCGGTERFISPTTPYPPTTASCNQYYLCVDEVAVSPGTLTIEFSANVSGVACDHFGGAIVEYVPTPMQTSFRAAATLTQRRNIRKVNELGAMTWTFRGQNITTAGLLLEQDRYACAGNCPVVNVVEVAINGDAMAARCGGAVGFSENMKGLSDSCGLYYHCGELSYVGSGANPKAVSLNGSTVTVRFSSVAPDSYQTTTNCEGMFKATLVTDGVLYSNEAGTGMSRTRYALFYNFKSLDTAWNIINANASLLLASQYSTLYGTSEFSKPVWFYRTFSMLENYAQDISYRFLVFDVDGDVLQRTVPENATAVCLVDDASSIYVNQGCAFIAASNWLTIQVAQTAFSLSSQQIRIEGSNLTRVCGGDQLFFGFHGATGQCNTYYKCYDGPVTPGDRIRITFTYNVFDTTPGVEPCNPRALAIVRAINKNSASATVSCSGDTPFTCVPESRCLPLNQLCDKATNCVDNSDEASCSNWNFVMSDAEPKCTPILSMNRTQLQMAEITPEACFRVAIGYGANSLAVTSKLCRVYNCLQFSAPDLRFFDPNASNTLVTESPTTAAPEVTAAAGRRQSSATALALDAYDPDDPVELYILTNDPSSFKYCTDALHCGGNGKVSSSIPPCQCTCDIQYVGSSCASVRDIGLVDQLVVVYPGNLTVTSAILGSTLSAVSEELPFGIVATVQAVTALAATSADRRQASTDSIQAVKIGVTSLTGGSAISSIYDVLTPDISARIQTKLAKYGVLYISATSAVGDISDMTCRRANLTAGQAEYCTSFVKINQTKSVSVSVPGIAFTSPTQYIDFTLETLATATTPAKNVTISCAYDDFLQSADPLGTGSCAYVSRCVKPGGLVKADKLTVAVSPFINPTRSTCEGFQLNLDVQIQGETALPSELRPSLASSETRYDMTMLYIAFALFGAAGLSFVLLLVWFKIREDFEFFKYAGPLLAGLIFFFTFFGVCLYAVWVGTGTDAFSHYLVLEEYRDVKCGVSQFSFIPHRVSTVPADNKCHQAATIGSPEGIIYMSVDAVSSAGPIAIRIGGSKESCERAPRRLMFLNNCTQEAVYFPQKSQLELQFLSALLLPSDLEAARVRAVSDFNPPLNLSSVTTVVALATGTRFRDVATYRIFFVSGQQIRRLSPYYSAVTGLGGPDHFVIYQAADLPTALANWDNITDPRIVKFKAIIHTDRTLFTSAETVVVNEGPYLPKSKAGELYYVPVGTFFNAYTTPLARSGAAASEDAMYFQIGYNNSIELDVGIMKSFTITFWMNADRTTRGVVYAVTDNWQTTSHSCPAVDRMMEVIENTAETTPWFSEPWNIYHAVYVNGEAQLLYFVWSSPTKGLTQIGPWDLSFIGASRLFDGGWHHVALAFNSKLDRSEAQLYVDGQTNYVTEGWRKCLPDDEDIPIISHKTAGSKVNIFNRRQEIVKEGVLLTVGYLNAGVYDLIFHSSLLVQEKILLYGSPQMALYSKMASTESFVLGLMMIFFSIVCLLISLYQVYDYYFGVKDDLEEDDVQEQGQAKVTHGAQSASNAQSVQFWQFVNPVAYVAQSMSLYLGGWIWPREFENVFGQFFAAISLDWMNVIPKFPVLVPAAIQFFLATIVLFAILYLAIRDEEGFDKYIANYRESKKERPRVIRSYDDDRPRPKYRWVVWTSNDKSIPLTEEEEAILLQNLTDMLTQRAKRDANMRLHTQNMVELGWMGRGVILYERVNGKIYVSFRAEVENQDDSSVAKLIIYSLEAICDNRTCPAHEIRLIPMDTNLPCIHDENLFYRSMTCSREGQYYKCPEELCEYAVCELCYFHTGGASTMSGAMAATLAKMHEIRQLGIAATVGTIVVLLASVVYLPVVKNAMMVIFCHPMYQCVFGTCAEPTTLIIIANLMAYIIVVFIGVGLIVIQVILLRRRHSRLIDVVPMQTLHRKFNCRLLPQHIPKREDWEDFLKHDNSMLVSLYEPFEFQYFWVAPAQLVFKACIIAALVIAEPNGLVQLGTICVIEALYALLVMLLSPYKNAWVESLSRLGSFHNLIQLGMMCLHRVEIRSNPDAVGYGQQMIWVSALYLVLVLGIMVGVIIVPAIRRYIAQRNRLTRGEKGEQDLVELENAHND